MNREIGGLWPASHGAFACRDALAACLKVYQQAQKAANLRLLFPANLLFFATGREGNGTGTMESLAGHLLIAPEREQDPDFIKTVILLIQHVEEQAFGVVLNRPTAETVRHAFKNAKWCVNDDFVYSGGPAPEPLIALHTNAALGEIEVCPGVFYSIQKKQIERLLRDNQRPIKIFQSHAGWGQGQLEQFMAVGPWRTAPATAELVFLPGDAVWAAVSKTAGS